MVGMLDSGIFALVDAPFPRCLRPPTCQLLGPSESRPGRTAMADVQSRLYPCSSEAALPVLSSYALDSTSPSPTYFLQWVSAPSARTHFTCQASVVFGWLCSILTEASSLLTRLARLPIAHTPSADLDH